MQHVSVISVPVSDQERSKRFYTDQVGFRLLFEASFGEHLHWIQVGPGAGPSLALVTWFDEMPAGSLRGLVFDCDDLDGDYAAMSSRGVPFSGAPTQQPGGVFATFIDPDGNRVSLRQADSSIGEDKGLIEPTR
jgi:predicted enzyme related to lactoylglutathione lyase